MVLPDSKSEGNMSKELMLAALPKVWMKKVTFFFFNNIYLYYLFSFIFISWRLITLQYCSGFCHTLTDFGSLWEKARVGCSERIVLKQIYCQGWNRSPAQVGCMRQVLRAGALGRPSGMGWGGRRLGGLGWRTHVDPWLIHVNVWQKADFQITLEDRLGMMYNSLSSPPPPSDEKSTNTNFPRKA